MSFGEQQCDNCRFFDAYKGADTGGYCRRFPPARIKGESWHPPGANSAQAPQNNDGWCGEWSGK